MKLYLTILLVLYLVAGTACTSEDASESKEIRMVLQGELAGEYRSAIDSLDAVYGNHPKLFYVLYLDTMFRMYYDDPETYVGVGLGVIVDTTTTAEQRVITMMTMYQLSEKDYTVLVEAVLNLVENNQESFETLFEVVYEVQSKVHPYKDGIKLPRTRKVIERMIELSGSDAYYKATLQRIASG